MSTIGNLVTTVQAITNDLEQARRAARRARGSVISVPAADLGTAKSDAARLAREIYRAVKTADEVTEHLLAISGDSTSDEDGDGAAPASSTQSRPPNWSIPSYFIPTFTMLCSIEILLISFVPRPWRFIIGGTLVAVCVTYAICATITRNRAYREHPAPESDADEPAIEAE